MPANLALVAADAGPLGLVVGHLLDNAVQASPAGGRVTVTARGCELWARPTPAATSGRSPPGPHVEVTVIEDAGPGVKPETCGRGCSTSRSSPPRPAAAGWAWRSCTAPWPPTAGGIRLDAADPGTVARFVLPVAAARPPVSFQPAPSEPRPRSGPSL